MWSGLEPTSGSLRRGPDSRKLYVHIWPEIRRRSKPSLTSIPCIRCVVQPGSSYAISNVTTAMIPDVKPPSPKQLKNEEALEIYAAFLCGLIILVIVARGLRKICDKTAVPEVSQGLRDDGRKACILVFRYAKSAHILAS